MLNFEQSALTNINVNLLSLPYQFPGASESSLSSTLLGSSTQLSLGSGFESQYINQASSTSRVTSLSSTPSLTVFRSVDDYSASTSTTGIVNIGGSATGNLEVGGDTDWFRVNLVAGTTYQFRQNSTTLSDPYLYLRDSAGSVLASDDDGGGLNNSLITYTATTSGNYYLDARAYSTSMTGTYTVSANVADDYGASTSTTGIVNIGGSATGNLEVGGDTDWFRVNLVAGTTYQFRQNATTLSDPFLYLRDSVGTVLTSDDDGGGLNNSLITYTATANGTYFLDARGYSSSLTGTYTVSASINDDYAASTATTGLVNVGGSATGNLEVGGDTDWFRVNLVGGTTYQFRQNATTLSDPFLYLRNSAGTVLTSDDDGGGLNNSLITYTATATGTYFLDARAYSSSMTGTYTVSAVTSSTITDDYAASTATTGLVNVGGSATGNLEVGGDTDWFRVNLVGGTTYQFRQNATTLSDPFLYLRDSAGTFITSNDDGGDLNNSLIIYTATSTGVYFLEARGYSSSMTGTYTISVGLDDDYAASTATTGLVNIGGSTTGNLEVGGDTDWFRVNLVAGTTYQFRQNATTLSDPFLYLRNSAGTVLASDDDGGGLNNSLITYTATATGTYFLDARAYFSSMTGTYTVSANANDDYSASTATTGLVNIGGSATGNLEVGGDMDWFRVNLVAGTAYQFRQNGTTLSDPFLYLRNSAGTVLASDDDGGGLNNSLITYTATATGTYFLDARAYSSSMTGNYTVSATASTTPPPPSQTAAWTYMVYVDGDNNLELAALEDFLEMSSIGSTNNVNIVVQLDRIGGYDTSYGNWTDTRRGLINRGDTPITSWGTSIGEANMGDQATLNSFVNWSMTNFQANNYALVIWNHGGGYSGISSDDSSGGDRLELREVSGAFNGLSDTLDLIGADACQMGMMEFAYQVRNNASVLVASEENIPWEGYSYNTVLADLTATPTMTASQLGTVIVNRYGEYYGTGGNTTLSAINLVNLRTTTSANLSTALGNFATSVMTSSTSADRNSIESYRSNASSFGDNSSYRDLGVILSRITNDTSITGSIRTAAQTALTAYNSSIIRNFTESANRGTGLAIYFQSRGSAVDSYYTGSNLALANDTNWDDFLRWWATA